MRKFTIILFLGIMAAVISCSRPAPKAKESGKSDKKLLVETYENELFSVAYPKGWVCDASGWAGLDSMRNAVDIYDPNSDIVSLHFVKTFLPAKWENIMQAKEFAIAARALSGDSTELIDEIDSVIVGGYPACILYFANFIDGDTIIQKQFVTYMHDSHIVVNFNEWFRYGDWEKEEPFLDKIIHTIKLKKVKNPLENDSILRKAVDDDAKNHPKEKVKALEDILKNIKSK